MIYDDFQLYFSHLELKYLRKSRKIRYFALCFVAHLESC